MEIVGFAAAITAPEIMRVMTGKWWESRTSRAMDEPCPAIALVLNRIRSSSSDCRLVHVMPATLPPARCGSIAFDWKEVVNGTRSVQGPCARGVLPGIHRSAQIGVLVRDVWCCDLPTERVPDEFRLPLGLVRDLLCGRTPGRGLLSTYCCACYNLLSTHWCSCCNLLEPLPNCLTRLRLALRGRLWSHPTCPSSTSSPSNSSFSFHYSVVQFSLNPPSSRANVKWVHTHRSKTRLHDTLLCPSHPPSPEYAPIMLQNSSIWSRILAFRSSCQDLFSLFSNQNQTNF